MKETLTRCLELLDSRDIPVKYFRSDSAAYQFDIIQLMDAHKIDFFIRADTTQHLKSEAKLINNWQKVSKNNQTFEVGEMIYIPFVSKNKKEKEYRAIVKRFKDREGQYKYYSILTSNKSMNKIEVLNFYNKRGAMERNFDDLKNNFNWKRLPFSYLNENLVFMVIGAISNIIYQYLIKKFSKKLDFVKRNFRLKNFIFHFVTVSAIWIRDKLKLFTNKNYLKIFE